MVTFLDEKTIKGLVPHLEVKSSLIATFQALSSGECQQPSKTIIEKSDETGDAMFFTGLIEPLEAFGVKVSPFLTARQDNGLHPVTAYTLLVSSTTGEPLVLADAKFLTTVRTAETTGLAVDKLIREDATNLAIIGAGGVAEYHLYVQVRDRTWSGVRIYSPTLALEDDPKTTERKTELRKICPSLEIASSADEAIDGADVILLCTSSGTPVIDSSKVKNGALVCSISTDAKNAHEVDPQSLLSWDVYCDYKETAPLVAGDMLLAQDKYGWELEKILADLPELCSSDKIPEFENTRYFRSTGLAVEDIAIAVAANNAHVSRS